MSLAGAPRVEVGWLVRERNKENTFLRLGLMPHPRPIFPLMATTEPWNGDLVVAIAIDDSLA